MERTLSGAIMTQIIFSLYSKITLVDIIRIKLILATRRPVQTPHGQDMTILIILLITKSIMKKPLTKMKLQSINGRI
jgi:hypothetical protein